MTLQPNPPASSGPRRQNILLVEDEPFVRDATGTILQRAGFEVFPAEDATAAVRLYHERNGRIDLVITDLVLPGRTGKQLGQDLRRQSPGLAVLITSGFAHPDYEVDEPESRTFFLAKPYSRRQLVERVERILAVAPLAQAATHAG